MLDFQKYMMRYGEFGIQAVIEQIERSEGVKAASHSTLEERWQALMDVPVLQSQMLAA